MFPFSSLYAPLRKLLQILIPVLFLSVLLGFPECCISGAQNGLLLWYTKVLPVLFPFFVISSFISSRIHFSPILTTMFLGMLCGYPMGAKNVRDYYIQGYFSKALAQQLLCICSNASPMFLIGYVYTLQLQCTLPLPVFLFAIYWPPFFYGILCTFAFSTKRKKDRFTRSLLSCLFHPNPHKKTVQHYTLTLDSTIEHSLQLICKIGCYIMLYSILCNVLSQLCNAQHSTQFCHILLPFLTGLLEMTTGIANIAQSSSCLLFKVTAITMIAAFGGCSSISQTKSALAGCNLSISAYAITKLLFGFLSGLSILLYQTYTGGIQ